MCSRLRLGIGTVLVLVALAGIAQAAPDTKQQHVHDMSSMVMPFDISKVLHIFRMTESGGVEKVIARDPKDRRQIELIRMHLKHEAGRFQTGNYSDPASLHGADMPGLKELEAGAANIEISYAQLPDGGQIVFKTKSLKLLTAIHRWFGAQLSEHGKDAKAE